MTQGQIIKNTVTKLIENPQIRTTITITPQAPTAGTYGGYGAVSANQGTAKNVFAIPLSYFPRKIGLVKYGDLNEGDVRIIVTADTVVDENDLITYLGDEYHVRELRRIPFNEEILAIILTLSKDL